MSSWSRGRGGIPARTITDQQVEEVIVKTLASTPKNAPHWSTRSMAAEVGLTPVQGMHADADRAGRAA